MSLNTQLIVRAIPLNKLKRSPKNVRTTPHTTEHIEALAANIHATRMLQMPVVEPEIRHGRACTGATGSYLVNIGEGRRLAQLLRVKRKQIKATEPIMCEIDDGTDATDNSLAENVIRAPMLGRLPNLSSVFSHWRGDVRSFLCSIPL